MKVNNAFASAEVIEVLFYPGLHLPSRHYHMHYTIVTLVSEHLKIYCQASCKRFKRNFFIN